MAHLRNQLPLLIAAQCWGAVGERRRHLGGFLEITRRYLDEARMHHFRHIEFRTHARRAAEVLAVLWLNAFLPRVLAR